MKESTIVFELTSTVNQWPLGIESTRGLDAPIDCEWSEKDGEVVLLTNQLDGVVTKLDWQECVSMKTLAAQRGMANPDRDIT